ncbi:hypothetical protein [Methylobacterium gnaphalii]|uniref:CYTH domain-containing protein n=1 Tax=Methylobacterium gnaphalii TaxID=1010610 RepID=A0A512JGG6_9HYPH|nr:hypothetical protein [Methylobacterium gnaphalii]GEP09055.1 hypothetical protein MGN01_09000 [Methylobacterium gnaphalii]GJD68368.1 hypothetical protein MMMDOFMJ_1291 [Methylobacterium gnaphalii]GLS48979.1 hypothetical protein GCM10007885_18260 [Methylobacterium gnaphalii]
MSLVRRFLIAPSLVRLIRKERGGSKCTEGYFAPHAATVSFVRIEGADCHLILATTDKDRSTTEERTDVPSTHGHALLDVCKGKIVYERTTVPIDGQDALIDHYVSPAGPDVVSVVFTDAAAARAFKQPAWFGAEVSGEAAFEPTAIAISGAPAQRETTPSNAALDAVLDLFEVGQGYVVLRKPRMAA